MSYNNLIQYIQEYCSDNIINIFIYNTNKNSSKSLLKNLDLNSYYKCNENNIECTICINKIQPNEYVRKLKCNHNFHKKCIDHWLIESMKSCEFVSCPYCRTNINLIE